MTHWIRSNRAEPAVRVLADRHYNRQKPGSPQFAPPGRCLVLRTTAFDAFWVSSWPHFVRHAWPGAWVCSAFRNEGATLSSDLIREAVACTLAEWGKPPESGMITFVAPDQIRRKRDPGRCFRRAGFKEIGLTKVWARIVLQLPPDAMPAPAHNWAPTQGSLFA